MTAQEYASLEENTGKHTLDVMDAFGKLKSIGFALWLNQNTIQSHSKDGWWNYAGMWKTTDECFEIYCEIR